MFILVYYMECLSGNGINCKGKGFSPEDVDLGADGGGLFSDDSRADKQVMDIHLTDGLGEDWPHLRLPAYQEDQLHTWRPAGRVFWVDVPSFHPSFRFLFQTALPTNPSSWPGENGKGVSIPKEEEKEKNEKFKLNQFNLLASDRIALNRSLQDVRIDG